MWYQLIDIASDDKGDIRAHIEVPAASPWFDGHFPGEPVLPGLAQISMVCDVIRNVSEGELWVSHVSRVRFKRIIRPDDRLKIIASPLKEKADAVSFRIQIQGDLVCSGVMRLKRKNHSE